MKLNIRPLSYEDYDNILIGWWKDWGWKEAPARDFLPQQGEGGVIVYYNNIPVCAGFLYNTNSKIAWITWVISNKEYRGKKRQEGVVLLLTELEKIGKNIGAKYIFTNNDNSRLIETFIKLGYSSSNSSNDSNFFSFNRGGNNKKF